MKELIKKLIDAGKPEALNSLEELKKAAGELGYTEEQVEDALEDFDGFPLDDEDLEEIAGGVHTRHSASIYNSANDRIYY